MTDTEPQPDSLDEDALRRRLINRIALAGVAIVALLGGLAVIDSLYVAPTTSAPKVAGAPVITEAVKPADTVAVSSVPAPEKAAETQAPPEPPKPLAVPVIKSSAEPEESSSPTTPLPRQPRMLTKPAEARSAAVKSAPPQAPAKSSTPIPYPHPLAQAAQAERHFVLQMGVFNNVENAQELLARLQKNGVPAQIEARVQVGPFKTKAEADEARTKLKAMGLNAGLLMAIHH